MILRIERVKTDVFSPRVSKTTMSKWNGFEWSAVTVCNGIWKHQRLGFGITYWKACYSLLSYYLLGETQKKIGQRHRNSRGYPVQHSTALNMHYILLRYRNKRILLLLKVYFRTYEDTRQVHEHPHIKVTGMLYIRHILELRLYDEFRCSVNFVCLLHMVNYLLKAIWIQFGQYLIELGFSHSKHVLFFLEAL